MTDNRTTEHKITDSLRGVIKTLSNDGFLNEWQTSLLINEADSIDERHSKAIFIAKLRAK